MVRPAFSFVLFGAALLLSSVGCAGDLSTSGENFEVTPRRGFLAPGGTATVSVYATEIPYERYTFEVVEDGGGRLVPSLDGSGTALYTAPTTPGTYHVRAGIVQAAGKSRVQTVAFVVR